MKRVTISLLAAAVVAFGAVAVAGAITHGTPDGNNHPYVGLLVFDDAPGHPAWRCSGSLISPTVVLTAGHCTYGFDAEAMQFLIGPSIDEAQQKLQAALAAGSLDEAKRHAESLRQAVREFRTERS